ncbi:MAG: 2'-deoxycytidine 5'-triphosphate deaminase [Parvularculales bacterium]
MTTENKVGLLPSQYIKTLIETGIVHSDEAVTPAQVQPASLDLRLGVRAWRLRASFLPGPDIRVEERLKTVALHEVDLTGGSVLETGCVYLAEIAETLSLSPHLSALANPKSSTGRLDVFTRLITDYGVHFDQINAGYEGNLYLEISPRTFSILVRPGSRLSQLRFRQGNTSHSDTALRLLHEHEELVSGNVDINEGVALRVNLEDQTTIAGYRAKRHAGLIDVDSHDAYDLRNFWEPLHLHGCNTLILDPDEFYILSSLETVNIPPTHAAEMIPYNPLVGEFRVHYAGFFDPGFGHTKAGGGNSRAVLEVRSHEVPFILEHGQIIGRLVYEPLIEIPDVLYGVDIKSNYQNQGLKLSRHFRSALS